jgi:membrane-associated protease RseP (regulator of RpoE activity)
MVEVKFRLPLIMIQTKSTPKIFEFESKKVDTRYQAPLYAIPLVIGAIGVYLLSLALYALIESSTARAAAGSISPLSNLLLPGVNPYIPILAGWAAIVVAVVAHELAHGFIAKINGINVNKMGILLFLGIPIGAFVEVDEARLKASPKKSSIAVLSAGATVNTVIAVISLVLLVTLVANGVRPVSGYPITGVESNSPLSAAIANTGVNITAGSVATEINGVPINGSTFFDYHPTDHVMLTVVSKTGATVYPLTLGLWTPSQCVPTNDSDISNATAGVLNATTIRSCIGITTYEPGYLGAVSTMYGHSLLNSTLLYLCVPDLPGCASITPFSYILAPFFTFSYNLEVYQVLFWLWFVNINLAILNILPIYGLDGGQVVREALDSVFEKNRWDKRWLKPTLGVISVVFIAILVSILAVPYL